MLLINSLDKVKEFLLWTQLLEDPVVSSTIFIYFLRQYHYSYVVVCATLSCFYVSIHHAVLKEISAHNVVHSNEFYFLLLVVYNLLGRIFITA